MKKVFTTLALLTCFLGAKAEWVDVYSIDYTTYSGFPFYVMEYVPEFDGSGMIDYGANYKYVTLDNEAGETSDVTVATSNGTEYYKIELASPGWHQYFIADGIKTELDGAYTVKALVKSSEAVTININMGWGWGDGQTASASVSIPASEDFVEVEWDYTGIGGSSCNLVAQPGGATATIVWKSLVVSQNKKESRPVTWQEWLTSDGQPVIVETTVSDIPTWMGNAETPWADPDVKFNDQDNNYLICAWGKERERNMNDDGGWDPFPCDIEQEEDGNHYYVVHGKAATTEGEASAWDNQFWIQSPKEWKSGSQLKIHFRYKASKTVTVATQIHKQNPSDYLIWHAIGDINFTTEWQEFNDIMTMADDMSGGWSIAFQLNQNDKEAIDFCFDDLSWQSMKLDEGFFVAGCNPSTGLEYDFDNAIQFEWDEDNEYYTAIIGRDGWVSQIMISTTRGNDAAFKGATLKPAGTIHNDPDEWLDYTAASLAKLNLPGEGVWKICLDPEYFSMSFEMLEGKTKEPIVINPNPTEIIINAPERDDLTDGDDGTINEEEGGTGQPWDSQFWIMANRTLETGEATVIQFKYKAAQAARVSTQDHKDPGNYLHWAAIGDVNFTEEWQDFEANFTVPSEANGMQSIAFNLSEIKDANVYQIKDVVWKLDGDWESLIDQTGSNNFWVKEGAGDQIHLFGDSGEEPLLGDVNEDTVVDVADISAIISHMAGEKQYPKADVTNDGAVDVADISKVISIMAEQ